MSLALLRKTEIPVGTIAHSMLTEAQYQAINGVAWVLMDGRSIAGSVLATITGVSVIADARGLVLRGKNNGRADGNQNPDGELTLGAYQADTFGSHTHIQNAHSHTVGGSGGGGGSGAINIGPTSVSTNNTTATNQNTGGNETRMKNVTMNIFIKIN